MKKKTELSFPIPFYTQRVTEESWKVDGFSDFEEGKGWEMRGCGIASFRMVVDGFLQQEGKPSCGGQGAMIFSGLKQEAYKPGVGWIHHSLANMAAEFGLTGTAFREKTVEDVANALSEDKPCIISITPGFRGGDVDAEGNVLPKGGHLVVAYGCEWDEEGKVSTFLVHHPSCFLEYNWKSHRVSIEEMRASFSGNFISFQRQNMI